MKLLDRIEESIEQLMEGSISRVFRNPMQPAEIGRKLERAMTSNLAASVGKPIAPNEYRVSIHPDDLTQVAGYASSLSRQFETWLAETAARNGYALLDRISVQLLADEAVRRREIRVVASIADRADRHNGRDVEVQRTEIYQKVEQGERVSALCLRVLDGPLQGQTLTVRDPMTSIGRALDNTIVMDAHDVSRHHANLELSGGRARIVDLNSTNGTSVNGKKVTSQVIRLGDEIAFGSLRVKITPFVAGGARN